MHNKLNGLRLIILADYPEHNSGLCGVYLCDHDVTDTEWDNFYREFNAEDAAKRRELCPDYMPLRLAKNDPARLKYDREWKAYSDWCASYGTVFDRFAKLHNMQPVDYTLFYG